MLHSSSVFVTFCKATGKKWQHALTTYFRYLVLKLESWLLIVFLTPSSTTANGDEPAGVGAPGAAGLRRAQQARTQARAADQGAASAESRLQPRRAHEDQRALPKTFPGQNGLSLRAGLAWAAPPGHSWSGRGRGRGAACWPDAAGLRGSRRSRWSPIARCVTAALATRSWETRADRADAPPGLLSDTASGASRC